MEIGLYVAPSTYRDSPQQVSGGNASELFDATLGRRTCRTSTAVSTSTVQSVFDNIYRGNIYYSIVFTETRANYGRRTDGRTDDGQTKDLGI